MISKYLINHGNEIYISTRSVSSIEQVRLGIPCGSNNWWSVSRSLAVGLEGVGSLSESLGSGTTVSFIRTSNWVTKRVVWGLERRVRHVVRITGGPSLGTFPWSKVSDNGLTLCGSLGWASCFTTTSAQTATATYSY
ncbi:hypothetical protein LR48_Vigan03g127700 [Vigna angularis]|uniref:Uncharacterized protein n=1 Tax=Phaseolus angularis TaxID=3914 RepID=A0A0L9U533_PHAAN|nr:hypothetical protein LR48_Vigan03g127700 [Vigna angularis]